MNATNNPVARVLLLLTWIASNADALAPITAIPKAPPSPSPVTIGIEAYGNSLISELVYDLVTVVMAKREREVTLTVPPGFPIQDLSEFENKSLDLAGRGYNGGNGLKFSEIFRFLEHNAEAIKGVKGLRDTAEENINHLREMDTLIPGWTDNTYLSTFRSVDQDVSCVYAVLKDTMSKQLTVVFCGSRDPFATRDWVTNINFGLAEMKTPERIKDNMKGQLQKRLLIHKGFNKYLFDNRKLKYRERPQRFDQITEDLKSLLKGEDGYSVFVTGHSLGGALSHITALKLAGAGESHDFLPRPVTCVSLASPFYGTGGCRRAFEQAELDGLLRCLRINNREDFIPTVLPFSIGFSKRRLYKHTGMNLRLRPWGVLVEHSSKAGAATAVRNFPFKASTLFNGPLTAHSPALHMERLKKFIEAGRPDLVKTLEEHYKDKDKVGKDFFDGKAYSGYSKDEEEVLTAGAEDIALSESE